MKLPILSSEKRFIASFKFYFDNQKVELIPLEASHNTFSEDTLLIFSPLLSNGVYTNPIKVWQAFLKKKKPNCKLIIAGFKEAVHENYIDLFNLPGNWNDFLDKAKNAGEEWEPIDGGGAELSQKLFRFYEGHGAESLLDIFNKIKNKFHLIKREMEKRKLSLEVTVEAYESFSDEPESFWDGLNAHWNVLMGRWNKYYTLFDYLPFYQLFKEIDSRLRTLNKYFWDEKWDDQRLFEADRLIAEMNTRLSAIKQDYVA